MTTFTEIVETEFMTGSDLSFLFGTLPAADQAACWERLRIRTEDRHRVRDGQQMAVKKPKLIRRNKVRHLTQLDVDRLIDLPAEEYLERLDPLTEPARGRCRCPRPEHPDNHPSASYRDTSWFCHVCAEGGGIYQAAAAISGLPDHGPGFRLLHEWTANKIGVAA